MKKRSKQKERESPEVGWGKRNRPSQSSKWVRRVLVTFMVAMAMGAAVFLIALMVPKRTKPPLESTEVALPENDEMLRNGIEQAEEVAGKFLSASAPQERLRWARNGEDVRVESYPEEARQAPGEIERMLGHVNEGGRTVTAFIVAMPSGERRLMEVVATEKGPKVDWDAYARYGTASWEDLCSGKADRAVVRVFCEPSSERPAPFEDQSKWTCLRISTPDFPQPMLGFAQVGSVRESMMKQVVLGSPRYRQRFTLEIVRHEGKDEPLFEIVRCLAVGWVLGEWDVEEEWLEMAREDIGTGGVLDNGRRRPF